MKHYITNTPLQDWITLTSWKLTAWDELISDTDYTPKKIDGYAGNIDNLTGIWAGTGKQKNFTIGEVVAHRMMQVSGARAHDAYESLKATAVEDETCTRIDVQITTEWPNADLFGVCRRWREKGRNGNFLESETGATVYLGAWGSDRFIRVYQKTPKLTRFEVCYKKAHAVPMWLRLAELPTAAERQEAMGGWLQYELMRINDPVLSEVFSPPLNHDPSKPPKLERRETTGTEKWIKQVVAPALSKYVRSHDVDEYLIIGLLDILRGERDELPAVQKNSDAHSED